MLDRAITFISFSNTAKSGSEISSTLFNNWQGQGLEQTIAEVLLQLEGDGYVREDVNTIILFF